MKNSTLVEGLSWKSTFEKRFVLIYTKKVVFVVLWFDLKCFFRLTVITCYS